MSNKYWIIVNGVQEGPFELHELAQHPGFGPDTPVWHDGLPDWTTASRLPETVSLLNQHAEATPFTGQEPRRPEPFTALYAPGMPDPSPMRPMPPTYLVWAVLSCICCCIPTGIVAIIYASKVAPLYNRGDYFGSKAASEKAGWWVIISFVAGLIWAPFSALWSMLTM